jgi:hypothetical protein
VAEAFVIYWNGGWQNRSQVWNQPSYPSTDVWIKKMVHIHNRILFSHKKKE